MKPSVLGNQYFTETEYKVYFSVGLMLMSALILSNEHSILCYCLCFGTAKVGKKNNIANIYAKYFTQYCYFFDLQKRKPYTLLHKTSFLL